MNKIIDIPRINRYALFSNVASVGGLLLLLTSVVLPLFFVKLASLSFVTMVIGLIFAMVGIYFANRWVRKPRPEDQIEKALKGLGDTYSIFHYPRLPIDHILLTPFGILIIETISYAGLFTYRDGKWKEAMTLGRAFRYVVEEHLGDPTKMVESEAQSLREKLIQLQLPNIPIKTVVLFCHPGAHVEAKNPPSPVCKTDKLRKYAEMSGAKLQSSDYAVVNEWLEKLTL